MLAFYELQATRIGSSALGYIIPTIIFAVSFLVAYFLYRHFTKKMDEIKTGK